MTDKSNNRVKSQNIEVFVTLKNVSDLYYLLKVVKRGFDVYCIPPHLDIHFSLHESGESHFTHEKKAFELGEQPPLFLVMGEAGTPNGNGIIRTSLENFGRASSICTAIYSISSLSKDFKKFNRKPIDCFVIDKNLFSKDITEIEVGVWVVPDRNKVSFEFNNRNISADMLYKVSSCEPQIWIYAKPV